MHWLISTLSVLVVVASLLAGCGPSAGGTTSKAEVPTTAGVFPLTITDDAGRSVTIQKAPETIVSLSPSNTEMLYAIGLADKVVGVDDYSDYPPEAKSKDKVGGFARTNIERVVALSPNIIFAAHIHVKDILPQLERRGLTVFVLQPGTVDDALSSMRKIGKIMGKSKEADAIIDVLQKRVDAVVAKTRTVKERPSVFFELDANLVTSGPGTFVDDLIAKAGGSNIAADAKTPWPQLNQEAIVAKDPQVIILADHSFGETPEKVKARPGWSGISAVRSGRIVGIDPNLTNRSGPRVVDGLELIARNIHPELFK